MQASSLFLQGENDINILSKQTALSNKASNDWQISCDNNKICSASMLFDEVLFSSAQNFSQSSQKRRDIQGVQGQAKRQDQERSNSMHQT
ncbi:hypothetical protein BLX87_06810 [Bacillus sp. VT-16-64]|nr:hypothetical protein BLX87_06810 [Bacillus sp. VT-16-64]